VPKNASLQEIQKAYRDLALRYHPKNNSDPSAEEKFTEINEAYTHLSDAIRRRNYDDFKFGELIPFTSHNIFNDFFNSRPFLLEEDDRLFRPILLRTPSQIQSDFERDRIDIENLGSKADYAETYKSSTVHERGP